MRSIGDHTKRMNLERKISLTAVSLKDGLDLLTLEPGLYEAIGFVSSHQMTHVFVYSEEAQNLKEGKWYPYKVFFPTPKGWLKIDNNSLVFLKETHYSLEPVEIGHFLQNWEGRDTIKQILGLNSPEKQKDKI